MSRLKWVKGARGAAPRVSECGRYRCEVVERGCRHEPGLYWAACFVGEDGNRVLLGSGGLPYRGRFGNIPAGGPLKEAKEDAQDHADRTEISAELAPPGEI